MIAKTLYVKGGTYTLATIKADYTMTRLVADDGKSLTDGKVTVDCIDIPTADIPKWSEVVKPPDPPDPMDAEAELPLVKAELDKYKAAVAEVTAMEPIIEQTIEQMEEIVL